MVYTGRPSAGCENCRSVAQALDYTMALRRLIQYLVNQRKDAIRSCPLVEDAFASERPVEATGTSLN